MNIMNCKFCNLKNITKSGIVKQKQRYLCKNCDRFFREGDNRVNKEYDDNMRAKALRLYINGAKNIDIANFLEIDRCDVTYLLKNIDKNIHLLLEQIPEKTIVDKTEPEWTQPQDIPKKDRIEIISRHEASNLIDRTSSHSKYAFFCIDGKMKWIKMR
jgi:transposase-like protein